MSSKFICGECGAENIISGFTGAKDSRRCSVCGAICDNGVPGAAPASSLEPDNRSTESPSAVRYERQRYGGGGSSGGSQAGADQPRKRRAEPLAGKILIALIIFTFIIVAMADKKEQFRLAGSKVKTCVSNMKTIEGAVTLYLMETGLEDENYPPELEVKVLIDKGYLKKEPRCPEKGRYKMSLIKINKLNLYDISCDKHGSLLDMSDKKNGL